MKKKNLTLRILEVLVIGGIIAAYILPLFSSEEEAEEESNLSSSHVLILLQVASPYSRLLLWHNLV